jgi:hypothetical protein
VGFGGGCGRVRCGGSVVVGGGGRFGGRGIGRGGWIGGEGDRSTGQGLELPAGNAELLAEADRREVALAVIGGASGELVSDSAADAAHDGGLLDRQELGASSSHLVACLGLDMGAANAFITYPTAVESAGRYIGTSGARRATDADRRPVTSAEATSDDDDARDGRSSGSANSRRVLPLTTPTRDRCSTHPSVRSSQRELRPGSATGASAASVEP